MDRLLDVLKERVLICDGATGTMLSGMGLGPSYCPGLMNIEKPDVVSALHRMYLEAGADILETNTFGANRAALAPWRRETDVVEINRSAARIAREAAAGKAYVAGAIGPLGPLSSGEPLSDGDVYDMYKEQAAALASEGVDALILETFSSLEQLGIALRACKRETGVPVIAQMVFPDGVRTLFGDSARNVINVLTGGGADVIGVNCGCGPVAMLDIAITLRGMTDRFISAQPNAGYPQYMDGQTTYPTSAEYFASYAVRLADAGVNIVGGCCGTTPDHIRLAARLLRGRKPVIRGMAVSARTDVRPDVTARTEPEGQVRARAIAEILPSRNADIDGIIETARMFKAAGADAVSFPDSPLGRVRMSSVVAAGLAKQHTGIEAIFHYTCRDRNVIGLQSGLLGAYAFGLRSVLAVTGDPASAAATPGATSVFDINSIRLVEVIANMRSSLGLAFSIGVAFNPNVENMEGQAARLRRKIDAGADFIVTQPIFEVEKARRVRDVLADIKKPLIAGILPLLSRKSADYFNNEVPGMKIPRAVYERIAVDDPDAAREEGQRIAIELVESMSGVVDGFYLISPAHKYDVTARIIKHIRTVSR